MPSLNFKHINANEQIFDGSIGTSLLADGSVTAAKLAVGAITSSSILINSPLNFNNFPVENFRIENVTVLPLPGNAGRLVWDTTDNELYIDSETAVSITSTSNATFNVITVVDSTHLIVSSTTGITVGDTITQGSNSTIVTAIPDATHLTVNSTVGFVGQGIASVSFGIVVVTDATHLQVDNTVGMVAGYTITQGIHSTVITAVIDTTHIIVGATAGFTSGLAVVLIPFNVITVTDSTHLVVSNTLGMGPADTITQNSNTTTIVTVTDGTHLVVVNTTGWAPNAAEDNSLSLSSTAGIVAGEYLTQGAFTSEILDVLDATHVILADSLGFVVGPASVGTFVPILEGAAVTSIAGTANEVLVNGTFGVPTTGAITLTTPQPIGTTSSPTFVDATLTALLPSSVVYANGSKALSTDANFVWDPVNTILTLSSIGSTGGANLILIGNSGGNTAITFSDSNGGTEAQFVADYNETLANANTLAIQTNFGAATSSQITLTTFSGATNYTSTFNPDGSLTTPGAINAVNGFEILDNTGITVFSAPAGTAESHLDIDGSAYFLDNKVTITSSQGLTLYNKNYVSWADAANDAIISVSAAPTSSGYTLYLPFTIPATGQFLTITGQDGDNSGAWDLAWATAVTGAAGSSGDVQFNNAGAFGADTGNFEFDPTLHNLFIGSPIFTPVGSVTDSIFINGVYGAASGTMTFLTATDANFAYAFMQADNVHSVMDINSSSVAVAIGLNASPAASAILDLQSTTQGFLPPRMTSVQRDAITSPATGLEIYNTDTNTLQDYNGASWSNVAPQFQQDVFNPGGPGNVFTLTFTPVTNSQIVFYNGMALANGPSYDYTISGNVVTLNASMIIGVNDRILVTYSY
jgi:hypothetical protein